jgi:hypothetical protein
MNQHSKNLSIRLFDLAMQCIDQLSNIYAVIKVELHHIWVIKLYLLSWILILWVTHNIIFVILSQLHILLNPLCFLLVNLTIDLLINSLLLGELLL